jgi:P4 family phage/plasmid primase-like protien
MQKSDLDNVIFSTNASNEATKQTAVFTEAKTLYTIYKLKSYENLCQKKDGTWIYKNDAGIWVDTELFTGTIEQISKRIQKNKGYHIRISKNEPCIVYIDFDHCKDNNIFTNFIELICRNFDVTLDEISYTLSNKDNELSYHISIPSIETTPEQLKIALSKPVFDEYKKLIDSSVYCDKWFRLPEQTLKEKPIIHKIINGKPEDFIINYVINAECDLPEQKAAAEPKASTKNKNIELKDGKTLEEFISRLLDILDSDRADDYKKWCDIAFIIHTELGDEGFELFDDFSRQNSKYNKAKVLKFYEGITDNTDRPLTVRTLMKKAKTDNEDDKDVYTSIIKEFIKNKQATSQYNITQCADGSFKDMAELIKNEFSNRFVHSSKRFYTYNENTALWEDVDDNYIKNAITELLLTKIDSEFKTGPQDDDKLLSQYKKANKMVGNPDNAKKILVYLHQYININNFEEKLNRSEDTLLPVKHNKCINLINGELIDRVKNHYFTFCIDIEYRRNIETPNADKFFKSIMNNNEDKFIYLQKILGSFLSAQTEAQSFYIWYGKGSNGKSALMKLISLVLGKFYSTVDKGLFIDNGTKKSSNAASPELLILKDIRLSVICETDENSKFNESLLKNLSGDDDITARGLFKDPVTFKPKVSPLILTNNKPTFDINSDAIKRRIKLINFDTKFVENPTKPNEQKINKYLIKSLSNEYLYEVLAFMVKGSIEFYKNTDMTPPKVIQDDINNYIEEIDPTTSFINCKLEVTNNKKDRIMKGKLYELFKDWSLNNGNTTPFTKIFFFKCVDKVLGEPKKNLGNYYYFNIKEVVDEDEEEDEIRNPLDINILN